MVTTTRATGPSRYGEFLSPAAILALGLGLVLSACMAQNLSRTVGQGNGELHVSAGGPFFARLGPAFPLPHTHVGGRYGVTDWMDVDSSVNLLAAPYGILAADAAANFQLYRKPGALAVAYSTRVYMLGDLNDAPGFRAYPELGFHLGGPIPGLRRLLLYGGTTLSFSLRPPADKPGMFVTPFVGAEWLFARHDNPRRGKPRQHGLALHAGWINPWDDSPSVVDYRPRYGAAALYLGYRLRFGGLDR